jgi:hypothetical protein
MMMERDLYHRRRLVFLALAVVLAGSATAQITVEGSLTQRVELEPGASHSAVIVVKNLGENPADVRLIQYDYRRDALGQRYYTEPRSLERSNAEWISISPRRFTIPAGEDHSISYVLTVPSDQSLDGSYWSMLMIEPVPDASPESSDFDPEETSVGITTLVRYAVLFVTNIGASGTIEPQITGATLTVDDGTVTLGVDVTNNGTRILDIDVWVELYDASGAFAGRWDGTTASVLPLSGRRYPIPMPEVVSGSYTALVVLDCGENNVFGASVPISIE